MTERKELQVAKKKIKHLEDYIEELLTEKSNDALSKSQQGGVTAFGAESDEQIRALKVTLTDREEQIESLRARLDLAEKHLCDTQNALQEVKKKMENERDEQKNRTRVLRERVALYQEEGEALKKEKQQLVEANELAARDIKASIGNKRRHEEQLQELSEQLEQVKTAMTQEAQKAVSLQRKVSEQRARRDQEVWRQQGTLKMNQRLQQRVCTAKKAADGLMRQRCGLQLFQTRSSLLGVSRDPGWVMDHMMQAIGNKECATPGFSAPQASVEGVIIKLRAQVEAETYARHAAEDMISRLLEKLQEVEDGPFQQKDLGIPLRPGDIELVTDTVAQGDGSQRIFDANCHSFASGSPINGEFSCDGETWADTI